MTRRWPVERLEREVREAEERLDALRQQMKTAATAWEYNGLVIERNIAQSQLQRLRVALDEAREASRAPKVARTD